MATSPKKKQFGIRESQRKEQSATTSGGIFTANLPLPCCCRTQSPPRSEEIFTMCTYIYTLHKDCMHKQYQNTFKCVSARGSVFHRSSRSLSLDHTLHLPDAPPQQMPDPMCNEGAKHATRPVSGRCRACAREERAMRQKKMGGSRDDDGEPQLVFETMAADEKRCV